MLILILIAFLFYFLGWNRSKYDTEYRRRKEEEERYRNK